MHRMTGLARPDQVSGRTGRQVLQAIIDGEIPQPPMAALMDFWLTAIDDGFAVFEGEPNAALLNPMGGVHGGWALTIIDSVTGSAAQTLLPVGASYTTVETKANFVRPIQPDIGRCRAEGRVLSQGRTIITACATISGPDARLLAHGSSTLLVRGLK